MEGLRKHAAAERSEQVLDTYTRAFAGFSDEQTSVLDGVVLEPVNNRG